ncbi:MAG: CoA transferase, partial [Desulfatiglans sp.]|nr:CoA transferase [Desulfatiglans sp.]
IFLSANNCKKGFGLNLKTREGIEIAKKLVAWADVVAENFSPGSIDKMGLGYEELKKVKEDIIMLNVSIQGQSGPNRGFGGFGFNTVSLTGISHLVGWDDKGPAGIQTAYPDNIAPLFSVIAVMCALDYRKRTGKGQQIDLCQYETTLYFLQPAVIDYTSNQRAAGRIGNHAPDAVPHAAYPCLGDDRWLVIAVRTDQEWRSLCRVAEETDWAKEEKFQTFMGRKANEERLDRAIGEWTKGYHAEELMAILQAHGVEAAVVKNAKDTMEDAQLRHRGFFQAVTGHGEIEGSYGATDFPFKMRNVRPDFKPAPCVGEDTREICSEVLGMSPAEIDRLIAAGVLEASE